MKTTHTDITVILDRSGSMASIRADTIGGFNRFLEDQKKVPGTATFSLVQFGNAYEHPIRAMDIQHVPPLSDETFQPHGSTALLDAIGRTVKETGDRLAAMPEPERPGKVVVVIITDGEENASREYSLPMVHGLIRHQREKYSWEFVFLGANQDAIKAGCQFGVAFENSITFAANAAGVFNSYDSVTSNMRAFRVGTKASMSFEPSDYKKQADAAGPNPVDSTGH